MFKKDRRLNREQMSGSTREDVSAFIVCRLESSTEFSDIQLVGPKFCSVSLLVFIDWKSKFVNFLVMT